MCKCKRFRVSCLTFVLNIVSDITFIFNYAFHLQGPYNRHVSGRSKV